jgi:hypothetical protein
MKAERIDTELPRIGDLFALRLANAQIVESEIGGQMRLVMAIE